MSPEPDSKAAELLEDMESADWGNGCLTEYDRSGMNTSTFAGKVSNPPRNGCLRSMESRS